MSENDKKSPTRDYEVGYGKPPKHTRFKPKSSPPERAAGGSRRRRSKKATEPIDISKFLSERIAVTKNGKTVKMTPLEIGLRAQVKAALTERSLPALKAIIQLALEFKLVKPASVAPSLGPQIQISKSCPDDIARRICNPNVPMEERMDLLMQWGLVPSSGGEHAE